MAIVSAFKKEIVKERLTSAISLGKYKFGQRMEGENQLAKEFNVSRGTLREVLADLANEGYIKKIKGSGTYIDYDKKGNGESLRIKVVVQSPDKLLKTKHFLGKLYEVVHKFDFSIRVEQVLADIPADVKMRDFVRRAFNSDNYIALSEITMNDLPVLVQEGLCEDLTSKINTWPQYDNLYDIAIKAASYNGRFFGFPFHSTWSAICCDEKIAGNYNVAESMTSIEGFLRLIEKISKSNAFSKSLYVPNLKFLLMHLLRAFYEDIAQTFAPNNYEPLDAPIGKMILEMVKLLRWEYNADIPDWLGSGYQEYSGAAFDGVVAGKIPLSIYQVLPKTYLVSHGMSPDRQIKWFPFSFGKGKRLFSLFNTNVWIINPRVSVQEKEFLFKFLSEYVSPESEYEIDRRYLEERQVNSRSNSFIRSAGRVPEDPDYKRQKEEFFGIAEPEISFASQNFNCFLLAAHRILRDRDANVDKEYDFYRSMLYGFNHDDNNHSLNFDRLLHNS